MGAVLLGVLINKASIPSARVVFSEVCLLTSRNGEPVLILRIGNTRGNFLLNPEIRVGYLKVPLFVTSACVPCMFPRCSLVWRLQHPWTQPLCLHTGILQTCSTKKDIAATWALSWVLVILCSV